MSSYEPAPPVATIARDLIATVDGHKALDGAPILYLFVDPPPKSKGREKRGAARLVSGLAAWMAEPVPDNNGQMHEEADKFFVVEIASAHWGPATEEQRRALVDHELSHLEVDGDTYRMRTHDLEEFIEVVKRNGLWTTAHFDLVSAGASQLTFDELLTPPPDEPPPAAE